MPKDKRGGRGKEKKRGGRGRETSVGPSITTETGIRQKSNKGGGKKKKGKKEGEKGSLIMPTR